MLVWKIWSFRPQLGAYFFILKIAENVYAGKDEGFRPLLGGYFFIFWEMILMVMDGSFRPLLGAYFLIPRNPQWMQ